MRELAKVYGIPAHEIRDFTGEALDRNWEKILQSIHLLEGRMRHLSLHCGGLVIVPDEIRKYVPVEISAKGLQVIQWEKDTCPRPAEWGLESCRLISMPVVTTIRAWIGSSGRG